MSGPSPGPVGGRQRPAIAAPVSDPAEVEALVGAGAGELYCGAFPEAWYRRFGRAASPNRRGPGPANLPGLPEVAEVCSRARALAVPVHVTLNSPWYDDAQAGLLVDFALGLRDEAGAAAVVVADPGLMDLLAERVPGLAVHASSVATALHAGTVRFFASLGARRVILSRHLRLTEIRAIRRGSPEGVDLEAFVLNDTCSYEEGLCATAHALPGYGVFCMTPWRRRLLRGDADGPEVADPETRARWEAALQTWDAFTAGIGPCGFSTGPARVPLGPCGLCAVPALARAGVRALKVVGREASGYRKLRSVQLVRAVLDAVGRGATDAEARALARAVRESPDVCERGLACYYRDERG